MWNPFRKKVKNEQIKQPDQLINRVDQLANTLQKENRINELEGALKKLDQSSLSSEELESWWHLFGITAFQEGRDFDALERLKEAYNKFPHSAHIKFSLGQQLIRVKDAENGFKLFQTCKFPDIPREYALAQARYAYLYNRYNDGMLYIKPFFDAYKQVKILDDHFLYVRGLPFFGRTWSYLAAFSILSDELNELESITKFVTNHCHDYDFNYLQAELEAYRNNNPAHLLEELEKRLHETPEGNFPTGYTRLNIAIIKARSSASIEEAMELLTNVTLGAQDFSWLEDVRTLALAESANRFHNVPLHQEYSEKFLNHQPMLFEPDIALNFHLLKYQENLKSRVIAS